MFKFYNNYVILKTKKSMNKMDDTKFSLAPKQFEISTYGPHSKKFGQPWSKPYIPHLLHALNEDELDK